MWMGALLQRIPWGTSTPSGNRDRWLCGQKPHTVCPYSPRAAPRQSPAPPSSASCAFYLPPSPAVSSPVLVPVSSYRPIVLTRVSLVRESMHFVTCSQESKTRIGTIWKEFKKIYIEVYLIYTISGVQQSDSVINIFEILFRYRLLYDTECSSLHYTLDPCCLTILYIC